MGSANAAARAGVKAFYGEAAAAYVKGGDPASLDGLAARVAGDTGDTGDAGSKAALEELSVSLASIAETVSARYTRVAFLKGLTRDDLRQEAMAGMLAAIDGWDREKATFKTHAVNVARFAILNAVNSNNTVSVNRHIAQLGAAYARGERTRAMERYSREVLEAAAMASRPVDSTDYTPPGDAEGRTFGETLDGACVLGPSGDSEPGGEYVEAEGRAECSRLLSRAGGLLTHREREVLALRYASTDERGNTPKWREIGGLLGITNQRACQVHASAITKLRSVARRGFVSPAWAKVMQDETERQADEERSGEDMDYRRAEAVEKVMREVREEHHRHLVSVSIECVFTDKVATSGGRETWAKAKKITGLTAYLSGSLNATHYGEYEPFFVLEVAEPVWESLTSWRRHALVDHELSHMHVDENGKLVIVGHDITEFQHIVARHGLWNEELEDFAAVGAEQLSLIEDGIPVERDEAREPAGQLRAVR